MIKLFFFLANLRSHSLTWAQMCPGIQSVFERNVHVLILTILTKLILNNFSLRKPLHRNRWQLLCFFFIKKENLHSELETVSSLVISTWQKKSQAGKEVRRLNWKYSAAHISVHTSSPRAPNITCALPAPNAIPCFNHNTEKQLYILII